MEQIPNFKAILSAEWLQLPSEESILSPESHLIPRLYTIQEVIKSLRGSLINTGVPTYLCVFPSVFEGILASTELLRQCRVKQGPSIRLALHYGPINEDSGLINDETIGVAVQIQSYGKTNAVVVSRAVYDQIYSHPQFKAKLLGKFEIQGLPGLTEVFVLMGFGLTPSFALNWISRVKESVQKASRVIRSIF